MKKENLSHFVSKKTITSAVLFALLTLFNPSANAQAPIFNPAIAYELGGESPQDLEVQDLNYDGHLDMMSVAGAKINFLLGDGSGRLLKDNSINMNDVRDVEFADFNNDGFLDMAIAGAGFPQVQKRG